MSVTNAPTTTDLEFVISSVKFIIEKLHKLEEEMLNLEIEIADLRTQVESNTKATMTAEFKQEVLSNLDKTLNGVKTYLSNLDKILDHNNETLSMLIILEELSALSRASEEGDSDKLEEFDNYFQTENKCIKEDLAVIDAGTKMVAAAKDYLNAVRKIYS